MPYEYRGYPSTVNNGRPWSVGGTDLMDKRSGVLEWCTSASDAETIMRVMLCHGHFADLKTYNPDNLEVPTEVLFVGRNYGTMDPLTDSVNYINRCECGGEGELVSGKPQAWQLKQAEDYVCVVDRRFCRCKACGRVGYAARRSVQAIVEWNRWSRTQDVHYSTLPLFGLSDLTPEQADKHMTAVAHDLRARLIVANSRRKDPDPTQRPGPRYLAKLEAYSAWAYYARHLIFRALREERAAK